jgi:hypothetical protein
MNELKQCRLTTIEAIQQPKAISLGLIDAKGREVGAVISLDKRQYRLPTEEELERSYCLTFCDGIPGNYVFEAYVQKTKNGISFGAGQNVKRFDSEEEANKYIQRRLKSIKA